MIIINMKVSHEPHDFYQPIANGFHNTTVYGASHHEMSPVSH